MVQTLPETETRGGEQPDWPGAVPGQALTDLAAPPAPRREAAPLVPGDCCDGQDDPGTTPLRQPCPQELTGCGGD